jgi:hypothetical protein
MAMWNCRPARGPASLLAACAVVAGCSTMPDAVRVLPELPAEYARDLAPARSAPVLMTTPARAALPPASRPPSGPVALAPARACTSVFEGYVTYPITVCYFPGAFAELVQANVEEPPSRVPGTRVGPTRHFKLTSHRSFQVSRAWMFCSVRSGPWYARVEGAQICNVDPNVRVFRAEILGAPEPVVVNWSGTLEDVPPPLTLPGIQQTGEFCTCCSGVMCPDGSCKPQFNQCGVKPPA